MKKKKAGQKTVSPLAQRGKMFLLIGNVQNAARAKKSLKWWNFDLTIIKLRLNKCVQKMIPCKPYAYWLAGHLV